MAEAPRDKGGDKQRVYDPINAPDTFFRGDPASNAELVRRALEAGSRLEALVGMPGEDIRTEVNAEKEDRIWGDLDTYNRVYGSADRTAINKAIGQKIHEHLIPDDEATAAKKATLRQATQAIARRKLGDVRLSDRPGPGVLYASQANVSGRKGIIEDQSNMGVTKDDVTSTQIKLGMNCVSCLAPIKESNPPKYKGKYALCGDCMTDPVTPDQAKDTMNELGLK